jgi:subtilase family protein/pre-peptidase
MMKAMNRRRSCNFERRLGAICVFRSIVLTASLSAFVCGAAQAHQTKTFTTLSLSKSDHLTLAQLRVNGQEQTTVLVATPEGKTSTVEGSLKRIGCSIKEVASEIGYIRCVVPIAQLDAVLKIPGIEKISLSTSIYSSVCGVKTQAQDDAKKAGPTENGAVGPTRFMARDNPFTASRAMQVLSFKEANPTYDGRGVAVGVLESHVDLLTPELKWAKDIHGDTVSKVLDWTLTGDWNLPDSAMPKQRYATFLSTAPWMKADHAPQVISTERVKEVNKGIVRFQANDYFLPNVTGETDWRMGEFDAQKAFPLLGPFDTNLDGVVNELDNYTILFDVRGRRVWLDLNHNKDFRDETPFRDFSVAREFGVFRLDAAAKQPLEPRMFLIHLKPDTTDIWLEVNNDDSHGDMVSSVLAADKFMGSEADGVAPGAQIVLHDVWEPYTHNYIDVLLTAFRDRRTDLITLSGGDDLRPTDGTDILDLFTSRMVKAYSKVIFVAAGNSGPVMGSLNSPSTSPQAISIGAYIPPEAQAANFRTVPTVSGTISSYSSPGPADNGGLKPELLGVTGTLSTQPAAIPSYLQNPLSEYIALPGGYGISSGTSAATPTAAGTAALLMSAAKQAHIPYDTVRLRTALLSTAKFLPGVEARAQGNGVIQVADAWQALQKLKATGWKPVEIVSQGPVKTDTSHRLNPPDRGVGIFETVGWVSGRAGSREIVFTRKSGPAEPVAYGLRWKGDTDAFTSAQELRLPLNQDVRLAVQITPRRMGSSSAILSLIDSETGLIAYQTLNTIVAPYVLDADDKYFASVSGKVPRSGNSSVFVDVPRGSQALHLVANLKGCTATLTLTDPDGTVPMRVGGALPSYENGFLPVKNGEIRRSIDDPKPGIWQVSIEALGEIAKNGAQTLNPAPPCDFQMTISAFGVDVEETATSVRPGQKYAAQFTNKLAPLNGRIDTLGLGSARHAHLTLSDELQQIIYSVNVPSGTSRLEAVVDGASDPEANVGLYLFDGTQDLRFLAAYSVRDGNEKRVEVVNPKAGTWYVVVDPYRLPNGPIEINYRDTFYHDAFGKVEVVSTTHGAQSNADTASFSVDVYARTAGPRTLVGTIDILSDELYVDTLDPDAKVPDPNPLEAPKPVPTKKMPLAIQRLVFSVE